MTNWKVLLMLLALAMVLGGCDTEEVGPQPDSAVSADGSLDSSVPDPDLTVPDLLVPDLLVPDLPPPTCTDKIKNGAETDMDCGGGTCPKCADTKKCSAPTDCNSGV